MDGHLVKSAPCQSEESLPVACKSHWHLVSHEVSKFIAADLLVRSVEHSGWNDEDHYKATILAYHTGKKDYQPGQDADTDDRKLEFKCKEEWLILKNNEKWRVGLTKQERTNSSSPTQDDHSEEDAGNNSDLETPSSNRPTGTKRAKTILSIKRRPDTLTNGQAISKESQKGYQMSL